MKPVDIESSIELDRLATCDEVRCTTLFSSQGSGTVPRSVRPPYQPARKNNSNISGCKRRAGVKRE
jgi:hypothetical protein